MKTRNIETEGLVTDKFIPNEDKGVVHQRIVNHKPILDYNKKLYTQNDGYSPDKGLKRVASYLQLFWKFGVKNIIKIKTKVIGLPYPKKHNTKF